MKKLINQSFFTGLLVILPIATTLWLVFSIVDLTDSLVRKVAPNAEFIHRIPGLGVFVTFVGILLIGFIARNFLGRLIFYWIEKGFSSIPFVNRVYKTLKQVLETLFQSQGEQFNGVVLLEFPHNGQWAIGFVTSHVPFAIEQAHPDGGKDVRFVFVPTAPNPTSGFLMAVDVDRLRRVDMTVEDAFKLIISGGIAHPELVLNAAELPP